MADRTATRNHRRRTAMIIGGTLVAVALAAVVATAVVNSDGADDRPQTLPTPETLPAEPQQPDPTFSDVSVPPPPDPRDFIADASKDTAPLSADSLFPGDRMPAGAGSYRKGATASTQNCASAASATLGAILSRNGCTRVIRATYEKAGVAVTVGVAVFDTTAEATRAKEQSKGNIQSLPGDGVPVFCRATHCRLTSNSVGRYAYFTVAGFTSGRPVPTSDTTARQAAKDGADYTFARIVDRGEAQASAAATASAATG
jgi:hypothetical protein